MIAVQLRYQYRVYPAPGQVLRARRVFGCKRVVWNDGLSRIAPVKASNSLLGNPHTRLAEGPCLRVPKSLDLSKELITAPPRFKSKKDNRQSARFTTSDRFKILDDGSLRLPKIGDVRVKWTRDLPSAPTSVTLIEDRSGRYWVSFVVETEPADDILPPIDGDQGIALGLTRFAVLADGSHIASPKYLRRAEKKLKKRQRELSRKKKGSADREKARIKFGRAHAAVADARRNFHHQWSHKLTSENQAVFAETLNVRGLARGRLAKSVHDAGWARFLSFCQYKATRRGRTFIKVPRDFPSSQLRHHPPLNRGPAAGNGIGKRLRSACETRRQPGRARNPHPGGEETGTRPKRVDLTTKTTHRRKAPALSGQGQRLKLPAWLTTISARCSGLWSGRATSSASRPKWTRTWKSGRSSTE